MSGYRGNGTFRGLVKPVQRTYKSTDKSVRLACMHACSRNNNLVDEKPNNLTSINKNKTLKEDLNYAHP